MNKLIILGIYLFFIISFQLSAQDNLIVKLTNGHEQSFSLNSLQKITFQNQSINIFQHSENVDSYSFDEFQKIFFVKNTTGIKEDSSKSFSISLHPNPCNDVIYVKNISNDTNHIITIYNLKGIQVLQLKSYVTNSPIYVGYLPKGIYFVKINNQQTFKITKS